MVMLKHSLQTMQTADHEDYADWYFVLFKLTVICCTFSDFSLFVVLR